MRQADCWVTYCTLRPYLRSIQQCRFGQMVKLVVIDDQEALRDGLVLVLTAGGIEVVGTASSALAATDIVRVAEPDVALISTSLPDDQAMTLTRELMAEHPALGVVLYSEDAGPAAMYDGLGSGADGYALKRGALGELTEAIERVAAGGSYVDPRLDHRIAIRRARARARDCHRASARCSHSWHRD